MVCTHRQGYTQVGLEKRRSHGEQADATPIAVLQIQCHLHGIHIRRIDFTACTIPYQHFRFRVDPDLFRFGHDFHADHAVQISQGPPPLPALRL